MYAVKYVSRREKGVDGEPGDVENDVVNAPKLFHPRPRVLQGKLAAAEDCGDGTALVGDEDSVNVPVVADAAAYRRLPIDRIGRRIVVRWLNPSQVGVLKVYEEATLLAKVAIQCVPYNLCVALASLHHGGAIRRHLQHEAVVVSDSLFPQALRFRK